MTRALAQPIVRPNLFVFTIKARRYGGAQTQVRPHQPWMLSRTNLNLKAGKIPHRVR